MKTWDIKYSYMSFGNEANFDSNLIMNLKSHYPLIAGAFLYQVKHEVRWMGMCHFYENVILNLIKDVKNEKKPVIKRDIFLNSLDRCELFAHILTKQFPEFKSEDTFAFMNRTLDKIYVIYPMENAFFAIECDYSNNEPMQMKLYNAALGELNKFIEMACSESGKFSPKSLWEVNAQQFMSKITNDLLINKLDKAKSFISDLQVRANSLDPVLFPVLFIDKNKTLPKSMAKFLLFDFQIQFYSHTNQSFIFVEVLKHGKITE